MKKLVLNFPEGYNIQEPTGFKFANGTIGDIINALVPYIFAIAGLGLLFYLIWGGFELLTAADNQEKIGSAKNKITNALFGFLIIFIAYWLMQILEKIFGIKIFG